MNKKLKKYLDEEERTQGKIDELQNHLKAIQTARQQEENLEIIKNVRKMKLSGRELFEVLCKLEEGKITLQDVMVHKNADNAPKYEGRASENNTHNGFTGREEHHEKKEFTQNH